jgi:hypothetical protein
MLVGAVSGRSDNYWRSRNRCHSAIQCAKIADRKIGSFMSTIGSETAAIIDNFWAAIRIGDVDDPAITVQRAFQGL